MPLVRVVGLTAVVLVVVWVAFMLVLVIARPRGVSLGEAKRLVPDIVRLLRALMGDAALPRGVRRRLVLLVAYLALPFDLVPDFVPLLGYADDVIVIALVLRAVVRAAGPDVVERHWTGTPTGLAMVRRLAGFA